MTRLITLLFCSALLFCGMITSSAASNGVLKICGDRDPLSMAPDLSAVNQDAKSPVLIGFSVELMRAVFATLGRQVEFISDLPFKRCLIEVQTGNIDFAMDAYFDLDRDRNFSYSTHYITLTPQIFYLKSRPVVAQKAADLKRYRGCGVLGTSYTHYGMRPENFDLGPDRDVLFKKMFAGRCDYFLEELEDIASFRLSGIDYLANPEIQHQTVSWAVPPSKFVITAKNSRNALLIDQINAAIYSAIKSGQAEKLWQKTNIGLPYKP